MVLDAQGKLTLNNSLSSGSLTANASSVTLSGDNKASGQVTVNVVQNIALEKGTLVSDAGIQLRAQNRFDNSGQITASKNLSATAQQLNNKGMLAGATTTVVATDLQNSKGAAISAVNSLAINSNSLVNLGVFSAPVLSLSSAEIDNSGLIQGSQSLGITGNRLTNLAGGTLSSDNSFALNLPELNNSGLITSGATLSLSGSNLTNQGEINAADIAAHNTILNNQQGGLLLADNTLSLQNNSLANAGQIAAEKLDIDTAQVTNTGTLQGTGSLQTQGKQLTNSGTLLSGGQMTVAADKLDNQGLLQGQQLTLTSSSTDNSGRLMAQVLTLQGDLINSGLMQGTKTLALRGGDVSNKRGGQLLSGGTLNVQGNALDNQGSVEADRLDVALQSWQNAGNTRVSTLLSAEVSGALHNSGTLVSEKDFNLTSGDITNAGTLAADQLNMTAQQVNNTGLLQADNALLLNSREVTNSADGVLLSGGDLTLTGSTFNNAGVWQGQGLTYQLDSLLNTGTVNGKAALTGTSSTLLDNRGSLLTGGKAKITAVRLLNSGKIMATSLQLRGGSLGNSGLWQGASSLDAQATNDLTQTSTGKALSAGDLLLNASNLSTAGTLQGANAHITANTWWHQGSLLGTDGMSAAIDEELRNDGELLSEGTAQFSAQNLLNNGSMLAEKAMTLNGGALNNTGTVQGETLDITPASVTNQGSMIGLQSLTLGPLQQRSALRMRIAQATPSRVLINNAGGKLLTQGTLSLTGDTVTNNGIWQGQQILLDANSLTNGGAIQSADGLQITLRDNLTSTSGSKISANGSAVFNALNFTNQGQWIAKNLTLQGGTLNNNGDISGVDALSVQLSGALTQQQNKTLLSAGKLDLHSASLSNAGQIQGQTLEVTTGAVNNGGRIQGDNNLVITASGRLTNNASGTLLSKSGLTLTTPELYNYGLIQGGTARITANNTANNSGKVLSAGELSFNTPQLTNSGWLQAAQLTLNAANASNSGTLLADQQGTLTGSQLQNQGMAQGGNLAVNYAQLNNSGTVLGVDQLTFNATQVTHQASGRLFSGGSLLLKSTGFDQLGQVVALGDATLQLINGFTGRNTLAAGSRLSISSNGAIENQSQMQGQAVTLSAGGDLTNNGQITTGTGDSSFSGNRINLNGAGSLQGGGNVALTSRSDAVVNGFTGTLGNLTINSPGSIINTALLYAGQNLYLYGNSIQNQRGDMLAGNSLWLQRDAAGNANGEVINTSGTIESQNGDITIKTGHLLNTRDGLTTSSTTIEGPGIPAGAESGSFELELADFSVENKELGYYFKESKGGSSGHGASGTVRAYLAPTEKTRVKRYLVSETSVTAFADGGAGRIAASRDLSVSASTLNNQASYLLAGRNANLSGGQLNNASWQNGTTSQYLTYTSLADIRPVMQVIVKKKPGEDNIGASNVEFYDPDRFAINRGNTSDETVTYILSGTPEYETTYTGDGLRAVIQAGGSVNASFSGDISNTSTTANAGWSGNTLAAPALSGLSGINKTTSLQRQQLTGSENVAINSPEWRDQLQNALQQVNGGATLVDRSEATKNLTDVEKAHNAASGTSVLPASLHHYAAANVDTSAYPLPSSENGYFVTGDSKSPYLITLNPKLNGLGQLDSSLFGDLNALLGKQPGSALQETRQQYTDVNTFLGSAYLLDRLNLKPESDYRFLGDAAFDTRYVSNTVLNQTGSRYLNGIGSELDQMQYLMDNAAAAQQSLGLQFGISLTAEQIASLDKSIIWWESASVNGQTVLVPKVYLSSKDAAINDGSVIAGNNVTLSGGNITNSGSSMTAQNAVAIDSQNNIDNLNAGLIKAGSDLQLGALNDINNLSSTISGKKVALESINGDINNITASSMWTIGGNGPVQASKTLIGQKAAITSQDALSLKSGKDINITGASLNAGGDLLLNAGHDLSLNSIATSESRKIGNKETHSSGAERTTLSSGGDLTLRAGQDITSQAAALAAEGDIGLQAGRDIYLDAEATTSGNSERGSKKTVINETVRQQGTEIASGGNTSLIAGHDINSQASDITAQQDITLRAGNNVDLGTATESDYYYKEETKTKKGLLSKKTTHTIQEESASNEKGTLLSGNNVSVSAGNDLLVKGSQVVGDGKVDLNAGNNVEIAAATNMDSAWRFSETKKSGLMGTGGLGISIGSSKSLHEMKQKGTTQSQSISTVGSTDGDVSITAGKQLQVNGADLIAGGNMALQGDSVAITPGHDVRTRDERFEQRTSGLTLALSGAVAEAVNSAIAAAQSAKQESDGRLAALQATKAVLSGVQANQGSQLAQANGDPNNGIGISLSLTTQQSKSQQHQQSDTVSGSTINSGKNLSIDATGKGNGVNSGDLLIAGSQLKAAGDTSLHAAKDITLAAASNTQQTTGKNSSSGGGVGISFGVGSGSAGLSIFASVNGAKGHEKGNGTVWSETTLDSGGDVSITSGRDTTLSGAQVNGNSIKAEIGRDLTMSSLQDSDNYDSKQTSFGAGGSFTFGSMTGSGYVNVSQDKMHSNYDSVTDQSGIYAGKGGFDITVGNHTQLNGAIIASQADADKNRLDTGTLGYTDIHNEADYKTEHAGIGVSSGASMGGQFAGNMANTLLAGAGGSGHAEGTTQSAVAQGTIIVRDKANQQQNVDDLSRDTEHANDSISPIFNKEKEQKRLQTAQLIGEIGSQVMDIARTQGDLNGLSEAKKKYPEKSAKELRETDAYKAEMAKYGTGSALQQGLSAATAAIQGLAGGDMAKAIAGAASPYLAEVIHNMTTDPVTGKVNSEANLMAHAVVGAVVAQINGNSVLAGASGAAMGEFIAQQLYPDIKREDLTEEQRQTISSLSTLAAGLAGGLTGDSSADAVAGAKAGKTAAENNNLAIVRTGAAACAEIAVCSKAVIDLGLGALIGVGVATSAMEDLSGSQKTNVMLAAMSGDQTLIDKLSPSERAAYEEWKGNQGLVTVFPVGEKDPTGGKLVIPAQDESKGTSLVTPDQSGGQGANNTGNTDGPINAGGSSTTTPIAEHNPDDLAYLAGGYEPNKGAVGNMGEFFNQSGFGSQMNDNARKTSQIYQGQSVYQAKGTVGDYIAKGDKYYLDGAHKNHLEVFNSKGKVKAVLNLDGSYNDTKTQAAIKEGRRLPK